MKHSRKKNKPSLSEILKGFASMSPDYNSQSRHRIRKREYNNSEKPYKISWENGLETVKHYEFKHPNLFGGPVCVERFYIGDISIKVVEPAALSLKQLKFLETFRPYI